MLLILLFVLALAGFWMCQWLAQHQKTEYWFSRVLAVVYCPLFRSFAVLLLLLSSYPFVFTGNPITTIPVFELLSDWSRWNQMINLLFFSSLLLPWIPVLRHRAISLPIQTMLATALLFSWWAESQQRLDYTLWPDAISLLTVLSVSFVSWWVLPKLVYFLSASQQHDPDQHLALQSIIQDVLILFMQWPIMLLYGRALFLSE